MSMHRRRHHRAESADERLERLIAMEKRAKSSPPAEERQPEMRRLKMVPEGNEAAAASASDGRRDETGRAGGATLAAGGRRAEAGGDGSRGREMTRPVSLPLELGPVPLHLLDVGATFSRCTSRSGKCWTSSSTGW